MVSEKILLLPTRFNTLSGVLMDVTNSPISTTVPVTSAAVITSPTLNGRNTMIKPPAARLASNPDQAMPMASATAASNAAKLVVSMPQ
ncbi:hypothetical protein ALP75_205478 [Pseudomonas syringae pv. actinidiae]|nr:hypothetical protein ALP75_205478 [Pseudomonas syringae pv. actinidiae]